MDNLYKTNLYYKDVAGKLQSITYGEYAYDTQCINDQGALVTDILDMDLPTPRSVILCCIEKK